MLHKRNMKAPAGFIFDIQGEFKWKPSLHFILGEQCVQNFSWYICPYMPIYLFDLVKAVARFLSCVHSKLHNVPRAPQKKRHQRLLTNATESSDGELIYLNCTNLSTHRYSRLNSKIAPEIHTFSLWDLLVASPEICSNSCLQFCNFTLKTVWTWTCHNFNCNRASSDFFLFLKFDA